MVVGVLCIPSLVYRENKDLFLLTHRIKPQRRLCLLIGFSRLFTYRCAKSESHVVGKSSNSIKFVKRHKHTHTQAKPTANAQHIVWPDQCVLCSDQWRHVLRWSSKFLIQGENWLTSRRLYHCFPSETPFPFNLIVVLFLFVNWIKNSYARRTDSKPKTISWKENFPVQSCLFLISNRFPRRHQRFFIVYCVLLKARTWVVIRL